MEHSYIGTDFMNVIESLICPQGIFYKSRLVWAGDYAKEEEWGERDEDCGTIKCQSFGTKEPELAATPKGVALHGNLYRLTDTEDNYNKAYSCTVSNIAYYPYIVNHTQKIYVDKNKCFVEGEHYNIHPLPLLTSEGNGKGGGDYSGTNEHLCGTWARDTVSMEVSVPEGYNELLCDFSECY
jgi:hypothetical protein